MYVVDASVWVSRFMRTDGHHDLSRQWLLGMFGQGETVFGPAVLLPEISGPIARISGQPGLAMRIVSIVQRSPNVTLVPVDDNFSRVSADLAAELRLRGADSLYVALARQLDVSLVTWDREQLERGSAAVDVFAPSAALA